MDTLLRLLPADSGSNDTSERHQKGPSILAITTQTFDVISIFFMSSEMECMVTNVTVRT